MELFQIVKQVVIGSVDEDPAVDGNHPTPTHAAMALITNDYLGGDGDPTVYRFPDIERPFPGDCVVTVGFDAHTPQNGGVAPKHGKARKGAPQHG